MPLSAGKSLGPYRIVALLGAGGMGEVYRANDPRLGREVAIKVLPASFAGDPDRLRRFEQEARAASALNHPNILTVHDLGSEDGAPYVVSELLEGETLRSALAGGPLPPRTVIDYALQIARGLSAAHDKGIVHRDLKPENLFVTRDGRVKILDFGLAKLTHAEPVAFQESNAPTAPAGTEPGVLLGTLGYMSPEQVRGRPTDVRSDIFAFGAILYEMLSGRRAFRGDSAADTLSAILKEDPPDLSSTNAGITPALGRIIRRCLEKNSDQRFHSAHDLAFDLEHSAEAPGTSEPPAGTRRRWPWVAATGVGVLLTVLAVRAGLRLRLPVAAGPTRISAVAVLPLRDLSAEPRQEYFADGMTDALTVNLAQISSLKVIAGSSAMQYKGTKKPVREVARELGVDAVLEGSVTRVGDRVRVTSELIAAGSDTHLWAKTFERDIADVLALQSEVAREVARQIEAKLTGAEQARLNRGRRIAPKAYEAYLLGRFFLDQGTEADLKKAFDQFTRALEIDEGYAEAYAGLSSYYAILPFYSALSPAEVFPKARAAAERSLELDEGLAEAHASMAYIRAYYEWDWAAAEREFRRAIALRPSYADAHFSYSRFLAAADRLPEAVAEIRRAEELDPRSAGLKANTALLSYFDGRYDDALKALLEIAKANPELSTAQWGLGLVYEQKGMFPEAIASIEKAASVSESLNIRSSLAHAYAVSGKKDKARSILDMLVERSRKSYVPSYYFAVVQAGLGDTDRAFEWLERAYQERSTVLAYLRIDPRLAPLRPDPRFASLLERVGVAHAKRAARADPEPGGSGSRGESSAAG